MARDADSGFASACRRTSRETRPAAIAEAGFQRTTVLTRNKDETAFLSQGLESRSGFTRVHRIEG